MSTIQLDLTIEEVNFLLQVLSKTPTSSGTWPLLIKIKEQAEAQLKNK